MRHIPVRDPNTGEIKGHLKMSTPVGAEGEPRIEFGAYSFREDVVEESMRRHPDLHEMARSSLREISIEATTRNLSGEFADLYRKKYGRRWEPAVNALDLKLSEIDGATQATLSVARWFARHLDRSGLTSWQDIASETGVDLLDLQDGSRGLAHIYGVLADGREVIVFDWREHPDESLHFAVPFLQGLTSPQARLVARPITQ